MVGSGHRIIGSSTNVRPDTDASAGSRSGAAFVISTSIAPSVEPEAPRSPAGHPNLRALADGLALSIYLGEEVEDELAEALRLL